MKLFEKNEGYVVAETVQEAVALTNTWPGTLREVPDDEVVEFVDMAAIDEQEDEDDAVPVISHTAAEWVVLLRPGIVPDA